MSTELKKILNYPANDINKILQNGVYSVGTESEREALTLTIKTTNRTVFVRESGKTYSWNGSTWDELASGGGGSFDLSSLPKYRSYLKFNLSKATDLSGLVTLNLIESSGFAIDWGDGAAVEMYPEPTTQVSHQYTDASFIGTIWFYGDWNGLGVCEANVKPIFTNVLYDENIKELPANTFENCTALTSFDYKYMPTGSYVIQDLFKIGDYAFANTGKLLDFDFYRAYIGKYCFYKAFYVSRLDIKTCLNSVSATAAEGAFSGNAWLDYIRFEGRTISKNMFDGSNVKRIDIVPNASSRVTINSGGLKEVTKSIIIHPTETAPRLSSTDGIDIAETIMVSSNVLAETKNGTNWVEYADRIYPYGGQYSEMVVLPVAGWFNKAQTVEVIGSTSELRNIIEFTLVDELGNQVEDTYGLSATQGTTQMTFTCDTVPTEDIYVFVKSTLTNY